MTEYENKSINKLGEAIHNGNWSNEGMVKLIELVANLYKALQGGQVSQ